MLKFMVVIYKRPELTPAEFRRHLEEVHGPLVKILPGIRKYSQNYVSPDPKRKAPGWDAMEAAWATPQGAASDADLPAFADLSRTTWSVVEEVTLLE